MWDSNGKSPFHFWYSAGSLLIYFLGILPAKLLYSHVFVCRLSIQFFAGCYQIANTVALSVKTLLLTGTRLMPGASAQTRGVIT